MQGFFSSLQKVLLRHSFFGMPFDQTPLDWYVLLHSYSLTLSWSVAGGRAYRPTRKRFIFLRIERAAKTEWQKKKLVNASAQSSRLSKHLRNGDSQHWHGTDMREWGWFTGRSIGGNAQLSCSGRNLLCSLDSSFWMEQPPNPSSLITHTCLQPWNLFPYNVISW